MGKYRRAVWHADRVVDETDHAVSAGELLDALERKDAALDCLNAAHDRLVARCDALLAALEDAEFLLRKAGQLAGPMQDSFNRSAADARAAIAQARGEG